MTIIYIPCQQCGKLMTNVAPNRKFCAACAAIRKHQHERDKNAKSKAKRHAEGCRAYYKKSEPVPSAEPIPRPGHYTPEPVSENAQIINRRAARASQLGMSYGQYQLAVMQGRIEE